MCQEEYFSFAFVGLESSREGNDTPMCDDDTETASGKSQVNGVDAGAASPSVSVLLANARAERDAAMASSKAASTSLKEKKMNAPQPMKDVLAELGAKRRAGEWKIQVLES